jgi:hypothetical protein
MENKKNSIADKIWTVCFAMMYPIITVFGLMFTGVVAVFSALSRLLVFIFVKKAKN